MIINKWPVDLRGSYIADDSLPVTSQEITRAEEIVLQMTAHSFGVSVEQMRDTQCSRNYRNKAVAAAKGAALLILKMIGVNNQRQMELFKYNHLTTVCNVRQRALTQFSHAWLVDFYTQILLALRHQDEKFQAPWAGSFERE
ncbi:MAG: hypothetical protein DSY80_07430 [Desulfocapsa sp.]|nr:MAG: hypothetical protein DSY80_07430 [Desulfocapsa sp.]